MAEAPGKSKSGLRKALERLRSEDDSGPDPEAMLAEALQIISDSVDGVSVKSLLVDIEPEFRSLIGNSEGDSINELVRLLGRLDFEELVGQAVAERIRRNGASLGYNALALLDISIDWSCENGPALSFGGLVEDSDRLYAWDSPLCSESWISWAEKNHMTLEDLEFVLGVKRGSDRLRPGDMVVVVGKKKRYPVFSAFDIDFVEAGDVGKVLTVKREEVVVGFPKKGEGTFTPSELNIAHSKVFQVRDFSEGEWVMLNPRSLEGASLGKNAWPEDLLREKGQVVGVDRRDSTLLIRFTKKRMEGFSDCEWIRRRLAVPTEKPESSQKSK